MNLRENRLNFAGMNFIFSPYGQKTRPADIGINVQEF